MLHPINPPGDEHKNTEGMLCPDCGSKDITLIVDDEHEIVSSMGNSILKKYNCKSCKCHFIPAALMHISTLSENINKWSKKVRVQEGNNDGQSWSDSPQNFIIIRKKKK